MLESSHSETEKANSPDEVSSTFERIQSRLDSNSKQQSKKRRREERDSSPGSPDIIPATPPPEPNCESKRKSSKRSSLSLNNPKSVVPANKTSHLVQKSIKEITGSTFERRCENELNRNKETSSPRKVLYELTHVKSPIKTDNSHTISPMKTDDDEILKGILEQLSPKKPTLQLGFTVQSKQTNLKKRSTSVAGSNIKQEDLKDLPSSFNRTEETRNDVSVRGRLSIEGAQNMSSSRSSIRKSLPSPSALDVPELKYPPLQFTPKSFKPNVVDKKNSLIINEKNSSTNSVGNEFEFKIIGKASSETEYKKVTIEGHPSPVRRSPRKHNSSMPNYQVCFTVLY